MDAIPEKINKTNWAICSVNSCQFHLQRRRALLRCPQGGSVAASAAARPSTCPRPVMVEVTIWVVAAAILCFFELNLDFFGDIYNIYIYYIIIYYIYIYSIYNMDEKDHK